MSCDMCCLCPETGHLAAHDFPSQKQIVSQSIAPLPVNSQLTVRFALRLSPELWISMIATAVAIFALYYAGRSAHAARGLR
jgi:hypothetical protein